MSFNENTDKKMLSLLLTTSDKKLLKDLSLNVDMNIRRAIARNKNIDSSLANKLLFDPVLNVSYMAAQNPNTTQKRNFDKRFITECVKCDIAEDRLDCKACIHFRG